MQDYIFLTHFARCYALASYKSTNLTDILLGAKSVCYIGDEVELHTSYCAEWGIDRATLDSFKEARANLAYTRFTLDCGMTGDALDLYVALAPCLLGYGEVGLRLFNDPQSKSNSPYWKWVLSYASADYQEACREGERLLERLACEHGLWQAAGRLKKLTDIFRTATKLEIGFWDMGLNIEW
jgi:hydroxymethylpyrimidine/phosphomethylpyrimidine kinase